MASIHERNGHFAVIYSYKDRDGKRKQKWETYKTKAEATRRLREVEYKKQNGTFIVPNCKNVRDLLKEYVDLYGKQKWALSTYGSNVALINNYINPLIGEKKLQELSVHFLEKFYQSLLTTPAVERNYTRTEGQEYITPSTIRDIHKILRSALTQAVKWDLIEKNPAVHANVPRYKAQKREIWTADVLMYAQEVCEDELLKLAINLSFAATLRINELLGLTWDCVDISEGAIKEKRAYVMVNKEMQRVSKEAVKALDSKDVIMVFPGKSKLCTTVRVLKTPKTESSVRRVFIPNSVAEMLIKQKAAQKELKDILGKEYKDYNLVIATSFGLPVSDSDIRDRFNKLIEDYNLPKVVFHSLRHSSITYKLKLNHGDVKAVQGDSGHSQVSMVTGVYSHIIDDDRKRNAQLLEDAFYAKKNLNPVVNEEDAERQINVPEGVDPQLLAKALMNPEMQALLASFAKKMEGD